MARTFTTEGRIGNLVVRGKGLEANVVEAVSKATLELSAGEVTQLTMAVADPDVRLLGSGLFEAGTKDKPGSQLDYGPLKLEVRALAVRDSGAGVELTVTARSLGACKLKRAKGELIRRGLSPTEFLALEAKAVGLSFVGEPSARRDTVVRQGGDQPETSWDTGARLAQELGYLFGEAAGVVYFGRPTWLIRNTATTRLLFRGGGEEAIGYAGPADDGVVSRIPNLRRSGDDDKAGASGDVEVVPELGDKLRPFQAIDLVGVPHFAAVYLVEAVRLELDDAATTAVSITTPVDPPPQPPEAADKTGSSSSSSSSSSAGGATAAAFVDVALKQAGDRYVYGAEAKVSDPDPDAFDCSELVEWALGRVGVKFVDGSSAQIARCKAIGVAEAKRTRGALLWHSGHIAISLGNGRTIEAMGRKYGVLEASSGSRFTKGGLVPGLRY